MQLLLSIVNQVCELPMKQSCKDEHAQSLTRRRISSHQLLAVPLIPDIADLINSTLLFLHQ